MAWPELPSELQTCILRIAFKPIWTEKVASYLQRGVTTGFIGWRREIEFRLGAIVEVADKTSEYFGKIGIIRAKHAHGTVTVQFPPESNLPASAEDDTMWFKLSALKRRCERLSDEREAIVCNIAVLRRVSKLFAQELKPIYTVSFLRRDIPIASAITQFVQGVVQISALLVEGYNAIWSKHVYMGLHASLHATVEYMCTNHEHSRKHVADYLYFALQTETAAALKRAPLASCPSESRVAVVRRLVRWFAYIDRYYCIRQSFPCVTKALIVGPRRPIYGIDKLDLMDPESRALARDLEAMPVPSGLLWPLTPDEAVMLCENTKTRSVFGV